MMMMILSLSKRFIPHPPSHDIGNSFIPSSDLHELPWKFHLHLYCVLKRALFREIWPFCTEPCEFHTSFSSLLYPLYIVMPDRAYGAKKWKQISKFTEQIIHIYLRYRDIVHILQFWPLLVSTEMNRDVQRWPRYDVINDGVWHMVLVAHIGYI